MAVGSPAAGRDRYGAQLAAGALAAGGTAFAAEPPTFRSGSWAGGRPFRCRWSRPRFPATSRAGADWRRRFRRGDSFRSCRFRASRRSAGGLPAWARRRSPCWSSFISGRRNPPTPAAAADDGSLPDRLKSLFRERTFPLLLAAFALCGFTTAGIIDVYFIPYALTWGFTLVEGAYGVHGQSRRRRPVPLRGPLRGSQLRHLPGDRQHRRDAACGASGCCSAAIPWARRPGSCWGIFDRETDCGGSRLPRSPEFLPCWCRKGAPWRRLESPQQVRQPCAARRQRSLPPAASRPCVERVERARLSGASAERQVRSPPRFSPPPARAAAETVGCLPRQGTRTGLPPPTS